MTEHTNKKFHSILFEHPSDDRGDGSHETPDFFYDLNCNLIVSGITSGKEKEEYDLNPFFYSSLRRVGAIEYRHEVFRDLEHASVLECVKGFAQEMRRMRRALDIFHKSQYQWHALAWSLEAVLVYCDAVSAFATELSNVPLSSSGLTSWREHLRRYVASDRFKKLASDAQERASELAAIRYSILFEQGGRFTVSMYENEPDYSAQVEQSFAKFKKDEAQDYRVKQETDTGESIDHVEAKMLEFVAKLNPEPFARLAGFCERNAEYADEMIIDFDREIHFYIFYVVFMADLRKRGLSFCYPDVSDDTKNEHVQDGFDLALAENLARYGKKVVTNSYALKGKERILVVTGPNQGGKTTFARMFGQLHYLARLGVPVPGTDAKLYLCDNIFTHFEREEKVENLRGKLEDDLVRAERIVSAATAHSVIVLNEIFTSTTLHDETFLSERLMEYLSKMDTLCVWVTFVDELSHFSSATVSMVSQVDSANPAVRTFKIIQEPANGLAYAMAIAHKYKLAHDSIMERIQL